MNQNIRRILFPILIVAVFLLVREFDESAPVAPTPVPINTAPTAASTTYNLPPTTSTNALILRVVDGDTIVVMRDGQTAEEKVRLLGVNTPESVDPRRSVECFGKEASKFTKGLLEGGRVRLDPDLQADDIDKYGRLLRNVVLQDGTDVNAELIKQGYAYAYVTFPMAPKRKVELKHLQTVAEQEQTGLWNPSTCSGQK